MLKNKYYLLNANLSFMLLLLQIASILILL